MGIMDSCPNLAIHLPFSDVYGSESSTFFGPIAETIFRRIAMQQKKEFFFEPYDMFIDGGFKFGNLSISSYKNYLLFLRAHNLNNTAFESFFNSNFYNRIPDRFRWPDMLVDANASGMEYKREYYEIKPNSRTGLENGLDKLGIIEGFYTAYGLPYKAGNSFELPKCWELGGYSLGPGFQLKVFVRFQYNRDGLIVYDIGITFDHATKKDFEYFASMPPALQNVKVFDRLLFGIKMLYHQLYWAPERFQDESEPIAEFYIPEKYRFKTLMDQSATGEFIPGEELIRGRIQEIADSILAYQNLTMAFVQIAVIPNALGKVKAERNDLAKSMGVDPNVAEQESQILSSSPAQANLRAPAGKIADDNLKKLGGAANVSKLFSMKSNSFIYQASKNIKAAVENQIH